MIFAKRGLKFFFNIKYLFIQMHLSYVLSCSHVFRKFSLVDIDLNGALPLLSNLALIQVVHNPDVPARCSVYFI